MSALEEQMLFQMRAVGIPEPQREFRFAPPRRWRFDFCWPDRMLAAEVEGGTWAPGRSRHTTGVGFEGDCEKYSEATIQGWAVLRLTGTMVQDGRAIGLIERAFA